MNGYICRRASGAEVAARWEYLTALHPGSDRWAAFRDLALKGFAEGSMIQYYGFLDGTIICEATAYVNEAAFEGDIGDPSGLYGETTAYLAAFRTDKPYEGRGYFSTLYHYMEHDLKAMGYTVLCLGVGADEGRNRAIYAHLGYCDYIKTLTESVPSGQENEASQEETVLFYRKQLT